MHVTEAVPGYAGMVDKGGDPSAWHHGKRAGCTPGATWECTLPEGSVSEKLSHCGSLFHSASFEVGSFVPPPAQEPASCPELPSAQLTADVVHRSDAARNQTVQSPSRLPSSAVCPIERAESRDGLTSEKEELLISLLREIRALRRLLRKAKRKHGRLHRSDIDVPAQNAGKAFGRRTFPFISGDTDPSRSTDRDTVNTPAKGSEPSQQVFVAENTVLGMRQPAVQEAEPRSDGELLAGERSGFSSSQDTEFQQSRAESPDQDFAPYLRQAVPGEPQRHDSDRDGLRRQSIDPEPTPAVFSERQDPSDSGEPVAGGAGMVAGLEAGDQPDPWRSGYRKSDSPSFIGEATFREQPDETTCSESEGQAPLAGGSQEGPALGDQEEHDEIRTYLARLLAQLRAEKSSPEHSSEDSAGSGAGKVAQRVGQASGAAAAARARFFRRRAAPGQCGIAIAEDQERAIADLDSIRTVASYSAQTALLEYRRRRLRQSARDKMWAGTFAVAAAAALVTIAGFAPSPAPALFGAWAAIGIAVVMIGCYLVLSLRVGILWLKQRRLERANGRGSQALSCRTTRKASEVVRAVGQAPSSGAGQQEDYHVASPRAGIANPQDRSAGHA
jgi:hypothetical protein